MKAHSGFGGLVYATFLVVVLTMGLLVPGCVSKPEPTRTSPAIKGGERVGYSYWRRHGQDVRTDDEAAEAVGFTPAALKDSKGRRRLGAVAVVGPDSDPRAPHWLLQFYDGFEFQQQRRASAEQASAAVNSQSDTETYGVEQGIATEVVVRGHKGYAWDKLSGRSIDTTDGSTLIANLNHAAVVWSEDEMFYALISYEDVKASELLAIARSMKR